MGMFDKFKDKAEDLAEEHGDTIEGAIDKVADIADDKTGGQYSDKIEMGAEKAKDIVEDLADDGE